MVVGRVPPKCRVEKALFLTNEFVIKGKEIWLWEGKGGGSPI